MEFLTVRSFFWTNHIYDQDKWPDSRNGDFKNCKGTKIFGTSPLIKAQFHHLLISSVQSNKELTSKPILPNKMTEPKVTLAHKKNLRDAEAQKPALLARIKAASGVDYTFEMDPKFEDVVVLLIKDKNMSQDNVGGRLYGEGGYLDHTAML